MSAVKIVPSMDSFTWTMLIMVLSPVNITKLLSLTFFIHTNPASCCDRLLLGIFTVYVWYTMYQVHFVRSLVTLFHITSAQMWCILFKILHLSQMETDYWTVQTSSEKQGKIPARFQVWIFQSVREKRGMDANPSFAWFL